VNITPTPARETAPRRHRSSKRQGWAALGVASLLAISLAGTQPAPAQSRWSCVAEPIDYRSGSFNMKAMVWRPTQPGKFPVVIYNHGSRVGHENDPFLTIDIPCWQLVAGTDLVVLWPERRGYGGSTGPGYWQSLSPFQGAERTRRAIARLHEESDDVLAGLDYLEARGLVDTERVAIMGVSLGAVVSLFAAAQAPGRFDAVIDQAGGFETEGIILDELIGAGRRIRAPLLIQHAANDGLVPVTTSRRLYAALKASGKDVIYEELPAVVWGGEYLGNKLDGHMIFQFGDHLRYWWPQVNEFVRAAWKVP